MAFTKQNVNYAADYSRAMADAYPYISYFGEIWGSNNANLFKPGMGSTMYIPSLTTSGARNTDRDQSLVYYDVTNYFFECDPDEGGLRRKGVSKEHRPNPIVQMGLLQDAEGVPIAYDLFEGNTNDCETLLPVLKRRRERGLGRVVVVADKGMNCSDNIAGVVAGGDGFVFSQSLRGTKSNLYVRP